MTKPPARGMAQKLIQELKTTRRRKDNGLPPSGERVALHPKTESRWTPLEHKMHLLLNFSLKIASEDDPDRLLHLLAEETSQILEADRCTVFLYDPKKDELWSKLAQGLGGSTLRQPKGTGLAGHAFTTRKTLNITDASSDPRFSSQIDSQNGYRTQTALVMPLLDSRGQEVLGVFEILNKKGKQPFDKTDEELLTLLAKHAAVAVENTQRVDNLKKAPEETIFRLALMAEYRNPKETTQHLWRMSVYTGLIAEAMRLPKNKVETLQLAAVLHDIGKIATPDSILYKTKKLRENELGVVEQRLHGWMEKLKFSKAAEHRIKEVEQSLEDIRQANHPSGIEMAQELVDRIHVIASQKFVDHNEQSKPLLTPEEVEKLTIKRGNLTQEERDAIQRHTVQGAQMLEGADSDLMRLAKCIAISHHEKYDGTGYPKGLKGDAIPLEGRIVALADVFDALSSKRMYKKGWSLEEILDFIKRESGKHFDPQVIQAFLKALPKIKQVMEESSSKQPASPFQPAVP